MSNKTFFGNEARAELFEGIKIVRNAVAPTMGANGRNVVYNKWSRVPIITNDGVSIAREIEPESLSELQGANLIKQVSEQTNDDAGDGTTGAIVLGHSIMASGIELLNDPNKKVNPMKLRREIEAAAKIVLDKLKSSAIPVSTLQELEHVATISVEDPEMGKTIAKAIFDAGEHGIVYINDSEVVGVSIEKVEGYQFAQGMITPYLFTNPDRLETVHENKTDDPMKDPVIFITEIPLMWNNETSKMLRNIVQQGAKNIVIICDEVHPDVIKFAVMNLAKGNFTCSIVKKPMNSDFLEDLSSLVGGVAMTKDKGLVHADIAYVGRAKKVVITKNTTTIFDGKNDPEKRNAYLEALKSQLEIATDEVTRVKLQERIARLTHGVFMLNIGEKTEAEAKYLKMKVEDAVSATKAARQDGIVAGGGMALWNAGKEMLEETKDEDSTDGMAIIAIACSAPLRQIVENSGEDYDAIVKSMVGKESGFNALTLKMEANMVAAGIIDPLKVISSAFKNASSFAGLLLTTEALITPLPEKATGLNV